MKVAIVGGTGKEGRGMALRWTKAGHRVFVGSRDAERGAAAAAELSQAGYGEVLGGGNEDAVAQADIVVLSVPYSAHRSTLEGLRAGLQGKRVIDITVPLKPPQVRKVHLPPGQAAALETREILGPDTPVVAALHHVSAIHLREVEHPIDCDVLACSDDADALAAALSLIADLGVRALDAGPLANAVALESLTPVLLHLNKRYKSDGSGIRFTGLSGTSPERPGATSA